MLDMSCIPTPCPSPQGVRSSLASEGSNWGATVGTSMRRRTIWCPCCLTTISTPASGETYHFGLWIPVQQQKSKGSPKHSSVGRRKKERLLECIQCVSITLSVWTKPSKHANTLYGRVVLVPVPMNHTCSTHPPHDVCIESPQWPIYANHSDLLTKLWSIIVCVYHFSSKATCLERNQTCTLRIPRVAEIQYCNIMQKCARPRTKVHGLA